VNRLMFANTRQDLILKAKKSPRSIALIYSPIELYEYTVEILSRDSEQFINHHNDICRFSSIKDAITKAYEYGANEFFLCADSQLSNQSYEYIPIYPKNKVP